MFKWLKKLFGKKPSEEVIPEVEEAKQPEPQAETTESFPRQMTIDEATCRAPVTKEEKIAEMACYYLNHSITFQGLATMYGISATTVGNYLNKQLPTIDADLAAKVKEKVEKTKAAQIARFKENVANKPKQ